MTQHLSPTRPTNAAPALSRADEIAMVARPVLRGVARGLCCESGGFQGAELWLLDDASRTLRLAARWAKKGGAFADRPAVTRRPLAQSPADVAALAGGAVVLESSADARAWDLPTAGVGAAIAVPVSSSDTIHGVLWLLAETPMPLADGTVELAEVVAGRLALEVERVHRADAAPMSRTPSPRAAVPVAPDDATPIETNSVTVEPVQAAAWSSPDAGALAGAGCYALADGRLLALAAAAIDSPDSSAATQAAAVEWLMAEAPTLALRTADAGLLLTLLGRRLQESPLAGEGLAVGLTLINAPDDAAAGVGGRGTWAFAGPTVALSIRAAATESHAGDLVPLGWNEPQAAYAPRPFELAVRERLVLVAGDPRLTSPLAERRLADAFRAATTDAHRSMSAEACLRRVAAASDRALAAVGLRRE